MNQRVDRRGGVHEVKQVGDVQQPQTAGVEDRRRDGMADHAHRSRAQHPGDPARPGDRQRAQQQGDGCRQDHQ